MQRGVVGNVHGGLPGRSITFRHVVQQKAGAKTAVLYLHAGNGKVFAVLRNRKGQRVVFGQIRVIDFVKRGAVHGNRGKVALGLGGYRHHAAGRHAHRENGVIVTFGGKRAAAGFYPQLFAAPVINAHPRIARYHRGLGIAVLHRAQQLCRGRIQLQL
ncbi:hypothetical protein SDC9_147827 [bioreactor metagenome]|uniref:Uncharacterized protein n=1 Tax=bioreactor metagenome TaxID=1076179 RepID=A0A645EFG2_9ZZZZ